VVPWDKVQLLAPVIPTKVVCVGKNYEDHAAEMGTPAPDEPLLFIKPATSVTGPDASVVYPPITNELHHEAELAVVISKVARHVKAEDAGGFILGYTAANDVTARDLQRRDGQWSRAKGFDTFCPLGPAIDTELDPLEGLSLICRVNGDIRQTGSTSDMVFGVGELIAYISQVMTLLPGDVILTGTPEGVGPIVAGDEVEVEIEGIGVLTNPVVAG
jgi:2-keto-4-pentenoate hydratase/2-oxohepta-3-ene-1,7-dioic acid hydratase in catechol pathway